MHQPTQRVPLHPVAFKVRHHFEHRHFERQTQYLPSFEAAINEKCTLGLIIQRVCQNPQHLGFGGSYQSVRRFVAKLAKPESEPIVARCWVWRIETGPFGLWGLVSGDGLWGRSLGTDTLVSIL